MKKYILILAAGLLATSAVAQEKVYLIGFPEEKQ